MEVPYLYILCGLPFAGKSTLAHELEKRLGIIYVGLDRINDMFGVGLHGATIPSEQWDRTYTEAYRQVDMFLAARHDVLFDAANFTRAQRDFQRTIADKHAAQSLVIYVEVPLMEVRRRWLVNRSTKQRHDVRDENFAHVVDCFEPPTTEEPFISYNQAQPLDEWIQQHFF